MVTKVCVPLISTDVTASSEQPCAVPLTSFASHTSKEEVRSRYFPQTLILCLLESGLVNPSACSSFLSL